MVGHSRMEQSLGREAGGLGTEPVCQRSVSSLKEDPLVLCPFSSLEINSRIGSSRGKTQGEVWSGA